MDPSITNPNERGKHFYSNKRKKWKKMKKESLAGLKKSSNLKPDVLQYYERIDSFLSDLSAGLFIDDDDENENELGNDSKTSTSQSAKLRARIMRTGSIDKLKDDYNKSELFITNVFGEMSDFQQVTSDSYGSLVLLKLLRTKLLSASELLRLFQSMIALPPNWEQDIKPLNTSDYLPLTTPEPEPQDKGPKPPPSVDCIFYTNGSFIMQAILSAVSDRLALVQDMTNNGKQELVDTITGPLVDCVLTFVHQVEPFWIDILVSASASHVGRSLVTLLSGGLVQLPSDDPKLKYKFENSFGPGASGGGGGGVGIGGTEASTIRVSSSHSQSISALSSIFRPAFSPPQPLHSPLVSIVSLLIKKFQENSTMFVDLCFNPAASPMIQLLLAALPAATRGQFCTFLWSQLQDDAIIQELITHATGSHSLQVLVLSAPPEKLPSLYTRIFAKKLELLSRSTPSVFVVQSFISSITDPSLLKDVFEELEPELPFFVLARTTFTQNVFVRLIQRAALLQTLQKELMKVVLRVTDSASPAYRKNLVPNLLSLGPLSDYFASSIKEAFKAKAILSRAQKALAAADGDPSKLTEKQREVLATPLDSHLPRFSQALEEAQEEPPNLGSTSIVPTISLSGSLLIQHLLNFQVNELSVLTESFSSLSPEAFSRLACDPSGSRVLESFFSSSIPSKTKNKLIKKMETELATLAQDRFGSRFIETLYEASDLQRKEAIVRALLPQANAIKSSFHGRFVYRKCRLGSYLERKEEWTQAVTGANRKKEMFADILEYGNDEEHKDKDEDKKEKKKKKKKKKSKSKTDQDDDDDDIKDTETNENDETTTMEGIKATTSIVSQRDRMFLRDLEAAHPEISSIASTLMLSGEKSKIKESNDNENNNNNNNELTSDKHKKKKKSKSKSKSTKNGSDDLSDIMAAIKSTASKSNTNNSTTENGHEEKDKKKKKKKKKKRSIDEVNNNNNETNHSKTSKKKRKTSSISYF